MKNHLPDHIDLPAAAEGRQSFQGRVPLGRLERVLPLLVTGDGALQVKFELGKDAAGIYYLAGMVTGDVDLKCQRCLEPVTFPLRQTFRLGIVRDEAAAADLPERYEALLVSDEPASVADIVSDEVLLALPLVALHEDDSRCLSFMEHYQPQGDEQRANPFAVLAELKQK